MEQPQQIDGLTRRRALTLAAGFGAVPFSTAFGAATEPSGPGADGPLITRPIPGTGERLPVVGLGTDEYYTGASSQRTALGDVVHALAAGGGSVIDSSSDYGAAETMLGAVLAENGLRPRIFIATKLEKDALRQTDLESSLKRLGVGKIDLMQVHNVVSGSQSLAPLHDWKARGLVRYIGITTSVTYAFDALEAVMRREKPDFIELNYSLGDREAERRLLPAAAELGVATLIDVPFGGPGGRNLFGAVKGKTLPEWARDFDAASWGQFFLKYVLGNGAVTVVIPGTGNPEHMADNLGAGRGRLPDAAQRQQMVRFLAELG
jgi:diketogulonate reductase-like aldo/keto reductase